MRILRLLSFKIFILVFIILLALSIAVSYYQIKTQMDNYEQMLTDFGMRTSELIRASTRHSMLENRKEATYHIIRTIAHEERIVKIRIYNKHGTIVFSADDEEINQTVDMEHEACYMCHANNTPIQEPPTLERRRLFTNEDGTRLLGFVTAIKNEESCYTSTCHFHRKEDSILGTLDVIISLKDTDEEIGKQKSAMITGGIAITLFLALAVGIFIWFFVHVPVHKLTIGTKEISSGNLDYHIKTSTTDEIGSLAQSFNKMTSDLKAAKMEITEWSNKLENRVNQKTQELKNTQERILQIEKMASLGQLSATVAHELNNPIAGILTYSKLLQKKLENENIPDEKKESMLKSLKMIESESDRSGSIVKNLLLFSRKQKKEIKPHQINSIIEASLLLIKHHLTLNNIDLKMDLQENLPTVYVDENQIKQALIAIFVNAVEAMENDGTLKISTIYNRASKRICVRIQDNGKGISEEDQKHIFEPFFTTKNAVKGVGLGLSVVYGIIQNHNGSIKVESNLNEGTSFIIELHVDKRFVEESDE